MSETDTTQEHNPEVNNLLTLAQALADEKSAITAKQHANRDVLRGYVKMGLASGEQAESVEAFYPTPKRKDKDASAEDAAPAAEDADKKPANSRRR